MPIYNLLAKEYDAAIVHESILYPMSKKNDTGI